MYLTSANLAHYLLSRGHIPRDAVVDGDFMVAEAGRRNRNYKVIRKRGTGLFIKQVKSGEQQAVATLQREAVCYQTTFSDPKYAALARLMPRYVDYDAARHILIVELVSEAQNLTEHHQRLGRFPEEVGRLLGEGLGEYHSAVGRMFSGQAPASVFPRMAPWILSLHRADQAAFPQLSGGNAQLIRILRQFPEFQQKLDELRSEWRSDSLIHGDMKWDNCLLSEENGRRRLRIVDWELADFGDASWDAGAIFQSYLSHWILSMPVGPDASPSQFIAGAGHTLDSMQPAIRRFWRSYAAKRGVEGAAARSLLLRCVRNGAARMVQTAFEYAYYAPQLSGNIIVLLQVSLNILKNPGEATAELFGL